MRKRLAQFLLVSGLLCHAIPAAHGQSTCLGVTFGADQEYVRIPSSRFLQGSVTSYSDADCQTEYDQFNLSNGLAHATSEQSAHSICSAHVDNLDFVSRAYFSSQLWFCFTTSNTGNDERQEPETKRAALGIVNDDADEAAALVSCRGKWPGATHVEQIATTGFSCWAEWVEGR